MSMKIPSFCCGKLNSRKEVEVAGFSPGGFSIFNQVFYSQGIPAKWIIVINVSMCAFILENGHRERSAINSNGPRTIYPYVAFAYRLA